MAYPPIFSPSTNGLCKSLLFGISVRFGLQIVEGQILKQTSRKRIFDLLLFKGATLSTVVLLAKSPYTQQQPIGYGWRLFFCVCVCSALLADCASHHKLPADMRLPSLMRYL
jgi:hypothetical protein